MGWRSTVLIAFALGVVLTVLVAWGCSLWIQLSSGNVLDPANAYAVDLIPDDWKVPPPEEAVAAFKYSVRGHIAARTGLTMEVCSPSLEWQSDEPALDEYLEPGLIRVVRAGWPFLCMRTARIDSHGAR